MDNSQFISDNQLIVYMIEGNQSAFKQLFDKYYDYAFKVACLYCSFLDAEEIVSDVFIKVWNNREGLKEIQNLRYYLFSSVKNQSLNYLRKKKIDTADIENIFDFLIQDEENPQWQMEVKELSGRLENVISNLPPKCRMVFQLVREEGMKYKDVAAQLSISENTVEAHLKKATKRIYEEVYFYQKGIAK